MENIYYIIPTLKSRLDFFPKSRYVAVFLYKNKPAYFFEPCNKYLDLLQEFSEFDFLVAYRKSGKLIIYSYCNFRINRLEK